MQLPRFENYCPTTTAMNALVFDLGNGLRVWFSYKTPVAFHDGAGLTVRENEWGPTTGKHLNAIDGGSREARKKRVTGLQFGSMLQDALGHKGDRCDSCDEVFAAHQARIYGENGETWHRDSEDCGRTDR